jgi:hypothetical protein
MARAGAAGVDPGRAVDYDLEEVAAAMRELFGRSRADGTAELSAWAGSRVSLTEVGRRAAAAIQP